MLGKFSTMGYQIWTVEAAIFGAHQPSQWVRYCRIIADPQPPWFRTTLPHIYIFMCTHILIHTYTRPGKRTNITNWKKRSTIFTVLGKSPLFRLGHVQQRTVSLPGRVSGDFPKWPPKSSNGGIPGPPPPHERPACESSQRSRLPHPPALSVAWDADFGWWPLEKKRKNVEKSHWP